MLISEVEFVPRTQHSIDSREQLVMEHLPSVRVIARKVHRTLPPHVEYDDLVSAGTVGLIEAVQRFDASRHVEFGCYARFRIRGAIIDWLRTLDWAPKKLRREARSIAETTNVLTMQLGRVPEEEEVAKALGMSLRMFQELASEMARLDVEDLDAKDRFGVEDLSHIPAPHEEDPLFVCLTREFRQRVFDAVDALPERERIVLLLYYYEDLPMRAIANTLGIVESRVSQIHAVAIRALRASLGVPIPMPVADTRAYQSAAA